MSQTKHNRSLKLLEKNKVLSLEEIKGKAILFFSEGQIEEGLGFLSDYIGSDEPVLFKEIAQLKGRFNRLENRSIAGTIDEDFINLEENRITESALLLIERIGVESIASTNRFFLSKSTIPLFITCLLLGIGTLAYFTVPQIDTQTEITSPVEMPIFQGFISGKDGKRVKIKHEIKIFKIGEKEIEPIVFSTDETGHFSHPLNVSEKTSLTVKIHNKAGTTVQKCFFEPNSNDLVELMNDDIN